MQIRTIDQFNEFINLTRTLPTGIDKPTPYLLVDKMIKLPDLDWKDPNLRILDPAFGFGTFLFACYLKLIPYHSEEHILNNMLYGVEIDSFRYRITKHNLGIKNLFLADFLSWETDMKFDAIVGNPPYQLTTSRGTSIAGGGKKLWMEFVNSSLNLLNENGYLVVVHPIGWRQIGNKKWKEIYQKFQILDAVLEPRVNWNVGISVDYYVLQNTPYISPTRVIYRDGTESLVDFLSTNGLSSSKIDAAILDKMEGDTLIFYRKQTHHSTRPHMSKEEIDGYPYPIQHTGAQDPWWSSKKHAWQCEKKIIVSRTGYLNPFYDNGLLGTSEESYIIMVSDENEANYIIRLLNSKLYKFIIKIQKTSGFNDIKMLNTLPYPKQLPHDFTDDVLYTYFNLTQEEIDYIEANVK